MALPEDLIEQASFLCEREEPTQADFRRAVSASYYALFHLLTLDAAENCKNEEQRRRFALKLKCARTDLCGGHPVTDVPAAAEHGSE